MLCNKLLAPAHKLNVGFFENCLQFDLNCIKDIWFIFNCCVQLIYTSGIFECNPVYKISKT